VLGEAARIHEPAEPRDLGSVVRTFLEHALGGEDTRFDEELLRSDPEGGSKAALQLPQ
jgi:hypothetical protein